MLTSNLTKQKREIMKWKLPSEETFKGVMALALLDEYNTPDDAKIMALRNARSQAESDLTEALDLLEKAAYELGQRASTYNLSNKIKETFLARFR